MPVFFTKKQKNQMRERLRKKKKQLKQSEDNIQNNNKKDNTHAKATPENATSRSKRPLPNSFKNNGFTDLPLDPTRIVVPAHLTGKDARKFRKDARRKAQAQGLDKSILKFVVEGEDDKEGPVRKKRKQFPCINDLVKAERLAAAAAKSKTNNTKEPSDDDKKQYIAMDCEMVGIGSEGKTSALARVSLVDWDGQVVLDTFVKVPTRVTDFRTHVSGITPKHVQSNTSMDVEDCRQKVASLLENKIVVGHALKNDFSALLIPMPHKSRIRDTAKYQPFQRMANGKWRPRKLRDLAKEHLDMTIQQAGESHDSVDDARATMELFKLVRAVWEKDLETKQSKQKNKR